MIYRYSLVSDLHVDHPHPKTPEMEENIIVAGDIGNGLVGLKMLQKLKRKGHFVFAVDGNHEHYANDAQGRSIEQTEDQFFLGLGQERSVRVADGLTILGCNGWYRVHDEPLWKGYMNDGRYCGDAKQVNFVAAVHANWLNAQLSRLKGKAIVVTHTAPTMATLDPRYLGHYSNEWYWNPWMGEIMSRHADKIAVWHHGHTHKAADMIVDGVRVVCNPRGYPGENPGWVPKTMEIEL